MLDNVLSSVEEDESLSDYYVVRSRWPLVCAHDGQALSQEWSFAGGLCRLDKERTIQILLKQK